MIKNRVFYFGLLKKNKMIKLLEKNWGVTLIITVIIAIGIFYVSSLSFPPAQPGTTETKPNLYHFTVFFVFGFFLLISLVQGKNSKFIPLAIVVAFAYGLSDEVHQLFVPGRGCSIFDVSMNTIGILSASLIYTFMLLYRKKG
jgi:VanZ family protein